MNRPSIDLCEWYNDGCSIGCFDGKPKPEDCEQCSSYHGPNRGLGDVVNNVMNRTGITRIVKKVHRDCNCEERRAKLNKAFPRKN